MSNLQSPTSFAVPSGAWVTLRRQALRNIRHLASSRPCPTGTDYADLAL